ncbi:MAG: ATPase, partial [Gammaproteobacteria bacterium]
TNSPFEINKSYAAQLNQKIETFKKVTKTHKNIFLAMISSNGIKKNMYSEEMVDAVVKLDDLFN